MAERELKGRVQRSVDFPDSVVPTHLRRIEFDKHRGLDIKFGPVRWTAVPAVGALGDQDQAIDVRRVVHNPSTWMILRRDALDIVSGLELEVKAGREEGKVNLRVLRSSGRPIAEGTAWDSDSGVEFEVRVIGVKAPRRDRKGTTLRGALDSSGRIRMRVGNSSP